MASKLWLIAVIALVLVGSLVCLPTHLDTDDVGIDLSKAEGTVCISVEEYQQLKGGATCRFDVELCYPTYAQLQQFLKDNNALTLCEGNCVDHAVDLSECAFKNGWAMYIVLLNAEEIKTGHVIGAFHTKDKGLIFIEPQTLWEVKVEIGYDYSQNFKSHNWDFPTFTIKQIGILK